MYNKYYSSKVLNYLYFNSNRWTKDKVNFNSCLRFLENGQNRRCLLNKSLLQKTKSIFFYLI